MAYWRRSPPQMQAATESVAVAPASAAPAEGRQAAAFAHDAAIRSGRARQVLQPRYQRRPAQPRLRLRHEGARRADPRLRRPLFLASAGSRGDPHRSQARRRHHRRGAAARHHRGYRGDPRRNRPHLRPRDRRAGRGPHQAEAAGAGVARGQAGREPAQAAAGDRRRRPRAPDQARRPPAQHAHAGIRAARLAPADRRGDARHLCAARRAHGHAGDARGARGPLVPHARSGSLCGRDAAAGFAGRAQPQPDRRDRKPARPRICRRTA